MKTIQISTNVSGEPFLMLLEIPQMIIDYCPLEQKDISIGILFNHLTESCREHAIEIINKNDVIQWLEYDETVKVILPNAFELTGFEVELETIQLRSNEKILSTKAFIHRLGPKTTIGQLLERKTAIRDGVPLDYSRFRCKIPFGVKQLTDSPLTQAYIAMIFMNGKGLFLTDTPPWEKNQRELIASYPEKMEDVHKWELI